jgi:hypothetical protein
MASMTIKNLGKHKVHFKDPAKKHEVVEVVFVDARGGSHKAKFALKDLRDVLRIPNGEVTVESVFTKADQVEIVR